jgi:hypothetical protein
LCRFDVDLSSSSFGSIRSVPVLKVIMVLGPCKSVHVQAPNVDVSFSVPDDETNYEVCTWGGLASAIFSNCHRYDNPDSSDQRVTGQSVGS